MHAKTSAYYLSWNLNANLFRGNHFPIEESHTHAHWEYDSICPACGKTNHVSGPVGEWVIRIVCKHCKHAHEYIHIVRGHVVVKDADE